MAGVRPRPQGPHCSEKMQASTRGYWQYQNIIHALPVMFDRRRTGVPVLIVAAES
jgi:hypothetical protein